MQYLARTKKGEYYFDDKFMFVKTGDEVLKLALFDGNYYKLRMFKGVPILEIDGLRMHLVKEFKTPLDYSKEVVKALRSETPDARHKTKHETRNWKLNTVLDTCMGLGYTAIQASSSCANVTTCEISNAVMELAKWNPWSSELFENENIEIIQGDIAEEIKDMPECSFNAIIHDPPRFSKAENLYSFEFYKELFRVLKIGGRLFHYVGSPGKGKGRKINEEVKKRLKKAGFRKIRYEAKLQGILACR